MLFLQGAVHKTRRTAAQHTLEHNGQNRTERIDREKGRRITADEHDDRKHKTEPCACRRAIERRADHDRNEHQRDGEHPEMDEAAHQLQYHNDGGKNTQPYDFLCVKLFHVFSFFLPCAGSPEGKPKLSPVPSCATRSAHPRCHPGSPEAFPCSSHPRRSKA